MNLLLIVVLLFAAATVAKDLKIERCGDTGDFKLHRLSVSPYPLRFPSTATVEIDSEMMRKVEGPFDVHVTAHRFSVFWFKLGCYDGAGSCQYTNACERLDSDGEAAANLERLFGMKVASCVISKFGRKTNTFQLELPAYGEEIMVNAHGYHFSIKLQILKDGKVISCNTLYFDVE